MKTDDAGRQTFLGLCDELHDIQEAQNSVKPHGMTSAALRNAGALVRVAQIAHKRGKNIAQGGSAFSVKDFIKHVLNKFPGAAAEDEQADVTSLDWKKNAQVAVDYFATTPTALCLAHPLGKSFEPKLRKAAVRQKRRDVEEVRPLVNAQGTATDARNVEKRKQQIFAAVQKLADGEKIRLAKLITNPQSFGETCENMFACSFLVEKNELALTLDENGSYLAFGPNKAAGWKREETVDVVRDIVTMDWTLYEKLSKELFPDVSPEQLGKRSAPAKPFFEFDPSMPEDKDYNDQFNLEMGQHKETVT